MSSSKPRSHSLAALIVPLGAFLLIASTPAHPHRSQATYAPTQSPKPTPYVVLPTSQAFPSSTDLSLIQVRVDSIEQALQVQTQAFSAAISRAESNMNLLLAIIAISSVVVALLGFGIVRFWISQGVSQHVSRTTTDEVRALAEQEIHRLRSQWDPKFAELYDEYKRLGTKKQP